MKAYSMDLRERVIQSRLDGLSAAEVAGRLKTSIRTVDRYWRKFQDTGQFAPGQHGGHRVSRLKEHDETLLAWIAKEPDLTLEELRQRLKRRLKVTISLTALNYRLNKLGLSFKKNAEGRRTRAPENQSPAPPVDGRPKHLERPQARVPG